MNFPRILHFIFISFYVGLCFPSASQSNSDSNTTHPQQKTSVEVNVSQNHGITQKIQEDVTSHILKPRFEANWRYSNDRSILMGEFWLPLMQCKEESVLFCDIRLMGDDNENKEFNIGMGYREVLQDTILGDGVAGAMLWFDRRFTDRDFQFNQVTVGGEWLGEQYDLRMNGYFPIDKKKSYLQANPNGTGQGFVGNQILVNTDQVVVEEVLPGIDFEVGSHLNFMNGITDSTRFFIGGYHFDGEIAEDITGVRTRIVSDITSDIQVGARFQHDDVRGSQTYVESTIRFPFGHKKKYKHEGLWSRLDETPERDIDVVSSEVVTVQGRNEPLLNATTGLKQNVIHVDNKAAGVGDGSIENPYNNLAAAEGAATTNDMIYVHKGDGTTTNQNVGITLDDQGQMLAGSGADLLYNIARFKTPNGNNITGVLVEATTAPMITNGAGNGVEITADNIFVSGITVDGATTNGIYALNADNVIIENVTSDNNTSAGVLIEANATTLTQVTLTNNTANNNGVNGLHVYAIGGGDIETVNFISNTVSNNTGYGLFTEVNGAGSTVTVANVNGNTTISSSIYGLYAEALNDGDITTLNFENNMISNSVSYGVRVQANGVGSTIGEANFTNNISNSNGSSGFLVFTAADGYIDTSNFTMNTADGNAGFGLWAYAFSGGDLENLNYTNNTVTNNTNSGIRVEARGVGSVITTANLISNTAEKNAGSGLFTYANDSGNLIEVNLTNNIANNSAAGGYGLSVLAATNGDLGTVNVKNNSAMNNPSYGFYAQSDGAGSTVATMNVEDNRLEGNILGLYVNATNDGDISQTKIEGNTAANNTVYGISINDDSAAGGVDADLGGGAFGSNGNNRVFNNTNQDLFVDLDGGLLKAENNWWGSASGLTGAETLLQDASTVDTTPFLTVDPD